MTDETSYGIRRCRDSHWHVICGGEDISGMYYSEEDAWQAAADAYAESATEEDVRVLNSLAASEEDRFNESGVYIPNEIPAKLRDIAATLYDRASRTFLANVTVARLTAENAQLRETRHDG